jgi:outer membrane protein OmpA-like peptidoglycan-associated protein
MRPEKGPTIDLPADLLFAQGTAELTAEGRTRVQALAAELRAQGDVFVVVRGYTDDDGSAAFNISLSEERALCVRELLLAEGLWPARVLARGLGPRFPLGGNDSAEGRARNRRITIEVRPGSTP